MNISKITNEELKRLEACKTAKAWAAACDAIKDARDGKYPEDWWTKVKLSGMMDRVMARWGESSELKLVEFDTAKETVLDETPDNKLRFKELKERFDADPNSLSYDEVNELIHLGTTLFPFTKEVAVAAIEAEVGKMPTFEEWLDSPEIRKEGEMWGKLAEEAGFYDDEDDLETQDQFKQGVVRDGQFIADDEEDEEAEVDPADLTPNEEQQRHLDDLDFQAHYENLSAEMLKNIEEEGKKLEKRQKDYLGIEEDEEDK